MTETLVGIAIFVFTLVFTLGITLVSMLVPLLIFGIVAYRLATGSATLVVQGPLAHALAASTPRQLPTTNRVKVGSCPSCGASRTTPSGSAYVYCDCCGQLMDWDFRAAMSDRRSKAPGPAYERLVAQLRPRMEAAKSAGDRDAYTLVQAELWERYATLCPAACPPRVGDPRYRAAWVTWSARSQATQDLDPGCQQSFAEQQQATNALLWDRSNPMQPKAQLGSYRQLLEAVLHHQQQVVDVLERDGLLAEHPDRASGDLFRKIGTAAFVQGWLPYLPQSEHQATLDRTGLAGEYLEPTPIDLTCGTCPSCAAALEVRSDAKRVVCLGCGHSVAVGGGSLPCHGCGGTIDVPPTGAAYTCPFCDLRLERIGLG
ncbi:MAG: hypothetical protein ACI8PZ_006052 [Myxococcota bacterium]|jgi:hypothetical protein